jgi:hypothetical protein
MPTSAKTSSTTIGERIIQRTFEAKKNTDCLLHRSTGPPHSVPGEDRSTRRRSTRTTPKRKICLLVSFS